MTPVGYRNVYIKWIDKIEEVMLKGLVKTVWKGYYADSFYKANGWKITFNRTLIIT